MTEFDVSGFLAVFFDEAGQRLQSMNQNLVLFEAGELDAPGLIQLRRDAHTIKGSAQMLGVQDIAKLAHLFEDAIACAVETDPGQRQPLVQFLYELHDSLQHRLQHVDGKPQLDTDAMAATLAQLKQGVNQHREDDQVNVGEAEEKIEKIIAQTNGQTSGQTAGKTIRKKRPRVAGNLIAAVMGSIKDSLQDDGDQQGAALDTESGNTDRNEIHPHDSAEMPVDFRPELAALEMELEGARQGSGAFLRVDRTRLNRLSNQIIELSSGRYNEVFPERPLQQIVRGFRDLKDSLMANGGQQSPASWQGEFDRQLRQLQHFSESMRTQQRRSTAMLDDLRDQVLGLMLRPLSTVFSVFPRAVRDIGMRCSKKVQLLVAGDAVEMDQLAAEALTEPLIHLINNAVAHGIESPEERIKCGKPEHGQITMTASRKGSDIEIVVMDDGRGLDIALISDQAVTKGLVSQQEVAEMGVLEIMELIFLPGFSTCNEISEIAGRGMGVTVVQDVIHELTGTIHIHSEQGKGSQFRLTIPVSVAVQQAILFRIADERFGMLENLVSQVLPYRNLEIKKGHGPYSYGYIDFEHHRVPVIDLHRMFGQQGADAANHKKTADEISVQQRSVMVVEHLDSFLGLVVDEIMDKQEILVREVSPYLKRYQPVAVMGCAIAADGNVLLLIDPNALKQMWRSTPDPELAGRNGRS